MFKRNPDVIAMVLICGALLLPGVIAHARANRAFPVVTVVSERDNFKTRVHHTVASLKQCLHSRSNRHNKTARAPIRSL